MYALENVRKFVKDNAEKIGERAGEIIARAEKEAHCGVLSGGAIEEIMQDIYLAQEFHDAVMSDPEHMQIGLSAIKAMELKED